MRVLVVEDDRRLAESLRRSLMESRMAVDVTHNGKNGVAAASTAPYDVIVLDLMLPLLDGLEVARRLRESKVDIPILMLTARDGVDDRVAGLEAGADDYLVKPFALREVVARLRALTRRHVPNRKAELRAGKVLLDTAAHTLTVAAHEWDMTAKDFAILEYFLLNQGRLLTRSQILEHAWDYDFDGGRHLIEVYIGRLRKKVTEAGGHWPILIDSHGVPRRVYAMPLATGTSPAQPLVVSRSVQEMVDAERRTLLILVATSAVLLVIGGVLTYWLAGRALRPVRTITGMARSISEHDLHRRGDIKAPPDELGELVDTFNSMLGRLEAAFTSMTRFTADASHELRAPLALMRTEVEGALSRNRNAEEYRRILESLQQEVEHLSRLSDQLLILARADAGALVPAKEPIDVADFLHETAARWPDAASKRGSLLEVTAPSHGQLQADPALLRRVVDNLIDNAVRHTADGTPVALRGYAAGDGWNVEVADHGPGVAPENRDRLFTRFARADSARSPEDGGAGLGLALSAAIAAAHGGTLELVQEDGRGAVFRLHIPSPPAL